MESEPLYSAMYELLKQQGFKPTDTLITVEREAREITLTPIKGYSQTLRRQLLTLAAANGWTLVIKPNPTGEA